jgi:hypothetical protein
MFFNPQSHFAGARLLKKAVNDIRTGVGGVGDRMITKGNIAFGAGFRITCETQPADPETTPAVPQLYSPGKSSVPWEQVLEWKMDVTIKDLMLGKEFGLFDKLWTLRSEVVEALTQNVTAAEIDIIPRNNISFKVGRPVAPPRMLAAIPLIPNRAAGECALQRPHRARHDNRGH